MTSRSVAAPTGASAGQARRPQRLAAPLMVAGLVLGASVLLHVRDPHASGSYGFCPWLVLTGTSCPGCGGLRAVNELTHGNLLAAASSNLLLMGALPVLAAAWVRWTRDRWQGVRRAAETQRALWLGLGALAVMLAFAVVRNLPFGGWLAP